MYEPVFRAEVVIDFILAGEAVGVPENSVTETTFDAGYVVVHYTVITEPGVKVMLAVG